MAPIKTKPIKKFSITAKYTPPLRVQNKKNFGIYWICILLEYLNKNLNIKKKKFERTTEFSMIIQGVCAQTNKNSFIWFFNLSWYNTILYIEEYNNNKRECPRSEIAMKWEKSCGNCVIYSHCFFFYLLYCTRKIVQGLLVKYFTLFFLFIYWITINCTLWFRWTWFKSTVKKKTRWKVNLLIYIRYDRFIYLAF